MSMLEKKSVSGPGTIVGANVKLVGTLYDASEIVIHGKIEGEVNSDKNISVTETAYVKGPVNAETVQIAGEVHGSITATGHLEILPTGKIFGSITTKDLNIRSGAIFVGKCNMPEGEKQLNLDKTEKEISQKEEETDYEAE
jgi:cytoskeletal protein CcmA (bactofilin family)